MTTQGFGRRGAPRRPPMANRKRPAASPDAELHSQSWGGTTPMQMMLCAAGALAVAIVVVGAVNLGLVPFPGLEPASQGTGPLRPAAVEEPKLTKVAADAPRNERIEQAVSAFFGFYHVNARARVEHCARHGVNIAAFAERFKAKHSGVYERAVSAANQTGLGEEQLWKLTRLNLASMVATDMAGAEDRLKSGPDGACKAMNDYAEQFVNNLDFKSIQPDAHGVLMGL